MARNPHRPGSSAAQSFRADEVDALGQLLAAVQRGAHPNDIARLLRSDALARVSRKVASMRSSIERQKTLGMHLVEGGKR